MAFPLKKYFSLPAFICLQFIVAVVLICGTIQRCFADSLSVGEKLFGDTEKTEHRINSRKAESTDWHDTMPSSFSTPNQQPQQQEPAPVKVIFSNIGYDSEPDPLYTDEYKNKRISNLIGKSCRWQDVRDTKFNSMIETIHGEENSTQSKKNIRK